MNDTPSPSIFAFSNPMEESGERVGKGEQLTGRENAVTLPRRFRSAFILYSAVRHKEIREDLASQGKIEKTGTVAKLISKDWRNMDPANKDYWHVKARQDKARYLKEMEDYRASGYAKGGHLTDLPRRPMSAYLAFSNERRAAMKRLYPGADSKDLSKMLAKAWKEASPELRNPYVHEEARLRAIYNEVMAPFRNKKKKKKKTPTALQVAQGAKKTQGSPASTLSESSSTGIHKNDHQQQSFLAAESAATTASNQLVSPSIQRSTPMQDHHLLRLADLHRPQAATTPPQHHQVQNTTSFPQLQRLLPPAVSQDFLGTSLTLQARVDDRLTQSLSATQQQQELLLTTAYRRNQLLDETLRTLANRQVIHNTSHALTSYNENPFLATSSAQLRLRNATDGNADR